MIHHTIKCLLYIHLTFYISYNVNYLYCKQYGTYMTSLVSEHKRIELVFPRPKREMDVYLPKVKGEDFFQSFSVDVHDIAQWFNEYEMDSMELKIESIINSPEDTKIILGSKAENNSGLTIVLRPKKTNSSNNYNHGNQALQDQSNNGELRFR